MQFVGQSRQIHFPANVMAVLRTSCDPVTGALKYGMQAEGAVHSHLGDVVRAFLGDDLLHEMQSANSIACSSSDPENGFFLESRSSRGGWRGLFLAVSNPSFEEEKLAGEAVRLVQR